jgi:RNA polymerase sigma-70 factor, ECF subfamily
MTLPIITFHKIYKKYVEDIMRFSFWLCGNEDDAKDLTSEAFIRLWTTPSKIEVQTVKMYLMTIVRNLYLQQQQREKRKEELHENIMDSRESIDKIVQDKSELSQVMDHLQSLSEVDRTALLLLVNEGFTYQQIADYLKISLANVKVKISRSRKLLRKLSKGE